MWVQDATREDLLNIVQFDRLSSRFLREVDKIDHNMPEISCELQFLWKEDPRIWGKLPSAIILEKMAIREFFAWTGTYLNNCRPLTAYCRVVTRKSIQLGIEIQPIFGLGELENICIGLIISEAATYLAGQSNVNRLSMTAYAGTYSFAISRAIAGNLFPGGSETISDLWSLARSLTGQKQLSLTVEELSSVWKIVFSIFDHRGFERYSEELGTIALACHQIKKNGEIDEKNWKVLTQGLLEKEITSDLFKGPRENRVLQLEYVLARLSQQTSTDKIRCAFIGGYLASRIAPGTFEHYELLNPFLQKLPTLLLWYGLCAGIQRDSKLHNFGFGIGRRIIRDIVQEDGILNKPKCDIALAELETLSSGHISNHIFQTRESGHLVVEICPCVNCTMRNNEGRQTEVSQRIIQQTLLLEDKDFQVRKLLVELDRSLNFVDQFRKKIGEITGEQKNRRTKGGKYSKK